MNLIVDCFDLSLSVFRHMQPHQNPVGKRVLPTWLFLLCPCITSVLCVFHPLSLAFSTISLPTLPSCSIPSSAIRPCRCGSSRKERKRGWRANASGCWFVFFERVGWSKFLRSRQIFWFSLRRLDWTLKRYRGFGLWWRSLLDFLS